MSAEPQTVAARLHHALRGMADALEAVRLETFLEHTAALTVALADAPVTRADAGPERAALLAELTGARAQLQRGQRLGAALNELICATATPESWPGGYGRDGQPALPTGAAAVNERG